MRKVLIFTGFSRINPANLCLRDDIVKKGKALEEALHLQEAFEETTDLGTFIRAKCVPETNINNSRYIIELTIGPNRKVLDGRYSCTAGADAQCKHAAALIHFVNNERFSSSTTTSLQWKKPSKKAEKLYPKGALVEEFENPAEPLKRSFKLSLER